MSNILMEYLTFGRHEKFFIQSFLLSSLFLLTGRVWRIPSTLVQGGTNHDNIGLILSGLSISLGVVVVVYISGKLTYSPRFNQFLYCLIASLLQIIVGTTVATIIQLFVYFSFGKLLFWNIITNAISLFVIGSIYSLTVAAWHYHRVLTHQYSASSFRDSIDDFLETVNNIDDRGQIDQTDLARISELLRHMKSNEMNMYLDDEKELMSSINKVEKYFNQDCKDSRKRILRGEFADGREEIDPEVSDAHKEFNNLKNDLRAVS